MSAYVLRVLSFRRNVREFGGLRVALSGGIQGNREYHGRAASERVGGLMSGTTVRTFAPIVRLAEK